VPGGFELDVTTGGNRNAPHPPAFGRMRRI
jgi:hypothetical protein